MIDVAWLPGIRALFEYVKVAITNMATRERRDEMEEVMSTDTSENKLRSTARRIGYPIARAALLLIVGPPLVVGAYSIITSLMSL